MNRRLGAGIGAFCAIIGLTLLDAGDEARAGLFRRQGGYYAGCGGYCGGCCGCSGRRHHHRRRRGGCCGTTYVSQCCGAVNVCGTMGCGTPGCAPNAYDAGGAPAPMEAPPPAPEASPSDTPPPAPSAEEASPPPAPPKAG